MHWFDIGVTIALILSGAWSCFRGLLRELLSLIGLGAASVLAIRGYPELAPKLAPVISTPWIRQAVGFALIFLGVMIVVMVCSLALRLLLRATGLSPIDRLLGGLFGLAKVILVVSVLLLMANKFFPTLQAQLQAESVLAPLFFRNAGWLAAWLDTHEDIVQRLQQQFRTP